MPPGREFAPGELDELLESMAGGSIQLSFLSQQESGPNVQRAFIKDSLDSSLAVIFECAGGNTGTDVEECERTAANMAGAFGVIKHVWSGGDSIVHLFEAAKPLPVVDWEAVSNATAWDVGAAGILSAAVHQASADRCHVTVEAHRVVLSGASPPHESTVFSRHSHAEPSISPLLAAVHVGTYEGREFETFVVLSPATLECAWTSGAFTKQVSTSPMSLAGSLGSSASLRELRKA